MGLVSYLPRIGNYAYRAAKVWDIAVIGDGGKVLENAYAKGFKGNKNIFTKDFYSNFWKTTKTAGKELEAYKAAEVAKHGSTWKVLGNNFRNIPADFKTGWARGAKYAQLTGKNKFLSQMGMALKKGGKSLGRVAGPAILLAFEIPNIYRATRDEGITSGLVETGKAAAKLGGFTAGAAIGQALIPVPLVGALIGGIVGDILVSKIVGKSYSEKQEMQKEKMQKVIAEQSQAAEQQAQTNNATNPVQQGCNPQPLAQLQQQLYANNAFQDDFMYNATKKGLNYQA